MGKYICKVLPGERCNEDFAPDQDMIDGIEVDGFILIGFKDGKPMFESMMGITINDISKWIRRQGPGGNKIRAACAIAEGEIRAMEITEEDENGVTLTGKMPILTAKQIRKILGND